MSETPNPAFPYISLVVPVHRVQGYLRACLDSILGQAFTDFEIIAIDDASPDGCGRILDEYAARDSRVRPVHLDRNHGIGKARDLGASRASGEYIFFLDSDDTLSEGALQAVADRLESTGHPDILLLNHVRTYWTNRVQASAAGELLAAAGAEVFTALERPEYLTMFAVVWNRVYRREFYVGNGFTFTEGIYEDALMVYKTMLTAESISCLPTVCVEYRQRRQGNSMRTPGREHFGIFDQYTRLFEFLDERPHLDSVRPLLFERMVSHFLFTLVREDRVLAEDRSAFFKRASAQYARFKPPGFTKPEGTAGLRFELMERGSYPAYAAVEFAGATRKKWVRRASRARTKLGRKAYDRLYRMHLRRPVDENLAVYSAYWDRGVACNPAAIYHKARELAPHIHGVWVVRPGEEGDVPTGVDHVLARSPRYWEVMARARYLINNVNFPNEIVKRPGQIHLQTHHGTPLKQMGIDQQRFPAAARNMSFHKLLERVDRWDYSLSSNQHSTETWERVYPCAFESLDSGYPRNDVYFRATSDDVARIRAELGIQSGQTALLYCPTVRDYQKGFAPRLDLERLCRELGPDHVVLVRAHYFYGADPRLQELQERGLIKDVSQYPAVEDLCLAADVLITDYSSVMFDYACLDRPIVAYADDWEVYSKARGVYFDLLSQRMGETPGATARSEDELIEVLRTGAWKSEHATALRAAFRERFVQYDDGHAAERVVRKVFLGGEATPAVLPLDQRTPAPAPQTSVRAEVPADRRTDDTDRASA
ncbi:CDP-glycerol:glycerophosphate glycerophosphotransferase [Streptomyces alfalfae]|uniref:Glycosyl transferase n=1 Tax=Streptomyces alfalfae TaxID=1642299 RepID=A0ABN4VCV1_9ACTN|nr:bifunctional glycosyltransferase family 2 protein/CDP-glycerol:glycerophosphate glycerophosphotransferase [Streptomyces alfalfae]AYA15414.1 CDP-glycerol:glycerophosphate glycerophosphotransferase [Streptomyces fradiae]APY85076.1 glycosyl transferase [Streptomyces alfalfae]QUI35093.1 bifunctional glycosyltransferase family 2 protein/CDP-glycerol:glycerophosphate glycerophosphotransferase [Streptomyces alfalfae]RXX47452.1 CDP-glycerol:glycerophosphate glycerophosphotransferase [Streptomyces al